MTTVLPPPEIGYGSLTQIDFNEPDITANEQSKERSIGQLVTGSFDIEMRLKSGEGRKVREPIYPNLLSEADTGSQQSDPASITATIQSHAYHLPNDKSSAMGFIQFHAVRFMLYIRFRFSDESLAIIS